MTNLTPYDRHQEILKCADAIATLGLVLGEHLYYFNRDEQYLDYDYVSFAAYLASPEVKIGVNMGYTLKRLYKTLILDLKLLPEVMPEWTKLEVICPHITEENKTELLSSAETLSRSDLKKLMREQFREIELVDLFQKGISDILRIVYDIEHMATEGQYKRLYDIKKMLKEM